MKSRNKYISRSSKELILLTLFVHHEDTDSFFKKYRKKYLQELGSSEETATELKKSIIECLYHPGPWRYNDIFAFIEIVYEKENRILSYKYFKPKKNIKKTIWFQETRKRIFTSYSDHEESYITPSFKIPYTNSMVIKAINNVIQEEEKFFNRYHKHIEYSSEIIKNTNWAKIINDWEKATINQV